MMRQVAFVMVVALIGSLVLRTFLVQVFTVPSASMEPLLLVTDRIAVSRLPPTSSPRRGEVVVFADPGDWLPASAIPVRQTGARREVTRAMQFLGIAPPDRGTLVKRVIGVGGDRVVCCDATGRIAVNGVSVQEPYLPIGSAPSRSPFTVVVPYNSVWVMGDNRSVSLDSRAHVNTPGGGFVPTSLIRGTVEAVVWPLARARALPDGTLAFAGVPTVVPAG